MDDKKGIDDLQVEVMKEIAKDVYNDLGKPIAKPTGELVGLVPRAIKAALAPVEIWTLKREYNVAEAQKLLEKKLENVSPDMIESPEPYIAIPAIQYISYCMDNEELRNMYASLLANSMNKEMKKGVHPSYLEVIKQLSPDEAKLLKMISLNPYIATIRLRAENKDRYGIDIIQNFSDICKDVGCEYPLNVSVYFDNLERLGLVRKSQPLSKLSDEKEYNRLKNLSYILQQKKEIESRQDGYNTAYMIEGYIALTDYGKQFCDVCVIDHRIIKFQIKNDEDF